MPPAKPARRTAAARSRFPFGFLRGLKGLELLSGEAAREGVAARLQLLDAVLVGSPAAAWAAVVRRLGSAWALWA